MAEASRIDAALRLAAIVESSDDAIISKDLVGIIATWNQSAERIFGYTAAEAVGQSIRMIVPDDRQAEEDEVLRRIGRGERVDQFRTVRRRKDRTHITVSLAASPIRTGDGAIVGVSSIVRDVTQQLRSEQQAEFLAEAGRVLSSSLEYSVTLKAVANLAVPHIADCCAVDIKEDGKIARVAVAHIDPAKIRVVETIRERYEDPTSPNSVIHVVLTGRPVIVPTITDDMVVRAARGDEERIEFVRSLSLSSYICVPLIAHGRTLGALTFVMGESGRHYTEADLHFAQDVAARAALAVDNSQAYEQVQAANRLKDEFLATLSHELRTPLTAIVGYTRLLQSNLLAGERQRQAVATVERSARSLTRIVEDILDVSRIIAGKVRLDVQAVDLPKVIEEAVESTNPAAAAKGVRVKTVLDPRAAPVSGDPDRIRQIVWNLMSNAIKFTARGGQIHVRLARVDSHVEVTVSDTGIGLSPDFLPYVFDRFRQADASTTRERGGLGLGLAIARHLVELHGGTIEASSGGIGKGATFRFRLPLMIVHADPSLERRQQVAGGAALPDVHVPNLHGLRILVVDDDRDSLALIRQILELTGAEVATAETAVDAVDRVHADPPDVLISDVGMPQMDGFELIAQLRRSTNPVVREIPAAALTAYARSADRAKVLREGFQMHLAKPVDPAELLASISALTRRAPDRE